MNKLMKLFLFFSVAAMLVAPTAELFAQSAPSLTASSTSLTFAWQMGAKLPASQSVSVRDGVATPTYTVATPNTDLWLIATPSGGSLPAALGIQVNPSTLSPGIYVSAVTVTVAGVVNPLVIAVTLTVTEPSSGAVVAPTTIPLSSPATLTRAFTLTAGPLPATFTATPATAWLSVSATAGALLPGQSQTVTVTANAATLVPATAAYGGKITVVTTSNGTTATQTVTVNFTVNPLAPTVTSVWPAAIPVGSPNTVVTIRGANFYNATTVAATGAAANLTTTLVAANVLLATIPAALLTAPGVISLTVSNPAPGGAAGPAAVTVGNVSTISAITNAASYIPGAISPGEIIAIFGENLGPAAAADLTISGGFVETSLGGVTVTIDGQAAPIVYASSSQVSVQVPYAARLGTQALGTARTFVLTYGTATPASTTVDIVATVPGLFTLNASGAGAALVLNYNAATGAYSINSSSNPAAIGSTVVFFLTGEGDYASSAYSPETGFIVPLTPPASTGVYPQLSTPPAVSIGGTVATAVNYAGPIPGSMLGLLQLNVVVPAGANTGNAVPLSVTIGTTQTQANVAIAVN
jgi:trimeric autotransporter adhesin